MRKAKNCARLFGEQRARMKGKHQRIERCVEQANDGGALTMQGNAKRRGIDASRAELPAGRVARFSRCDSHTAQPAGYTARHRGTAVQRSLRNARSNARLNDEV